MRCGPAVGVVGILVMVLGWAWMDTAAAAVPELKVPAWEAPWAKPNTKVLASDAGGEFMYCEGLLDDAQTLEVWRWAGQKLERHAQVPFAESVLTGVWIGGGRYVLTDVKRKDVVIHDGSKHAELTRVPVEAGWYCSRFGVSRKGGHTAVVLEENSSPRPAGYDFAFARLRVGVLDNEKMTMRWAATLRRQRSAIHVSGLTASDDGRYVAVSGWGNGVSLVDAEAGKALLEKRPRRETDTETSAFSPDGEVLYMGGEEGCLYVVKVSTGAILHEWSPSPEGKEKFGWPIKHIAASPDGRLVAVGLAGGLVCVMDARTGQHLRYVSRGLTVHAISFSPDSKWLATEGGGGFRVWEMPGGGR